MVGALVAMLAAGQRPERVEVMLKAALHKELVEGDLKGAIEQYRRVVSRAGTNRAAAAQALLRMGQCYERLGHGDARRSYEQLVREYPDQNEAVLQARTRLAALGPGARVENGKSIWLRQVWAGPEADSFGSPSPDGRYLSFTDWTTGDLAIRDLATGQNRRVTNKGEPFSESDAQAWWSIFSPDGKRLAYHWWENGGRQIRVVNVDGSGVRTIYPRTEAWLQPYDWSPDGRSVLATRVQEPEGASLTTEVLLIGAADGSIRLVRELNRPVWGKMKFSPDGQQILYDAPPKQGEPTSDIYLLSIDGSRDVALIEHPALDFVLGWANSGNRILFGSNRGGTVGVWAQAVVDGKAQGAPRLVKANTEVFHPLGLTRRGSLYYELNTDLLDVYTAEVDLEAGKAVSDPKPASGRYRGRKRYPHWSPDGKSLLYVAEIPGAERILVIQSVESGEEREIRPPVSHLSRPTWHPDGRSIVVFGTGQDGRRGFYSIDAATGAPRLALEATRMPQVLPDAAFSPDGKAMFVYTPKAIYRVQLETQEIEELFATSSERGGLGQALLSLSPDGKQLAFQLADFPGRLRRVMVMAATGGEPREALRIPDPDLFLCCRAFSWTADSRKLVASRGRLGPAGVRAPNELWQVPLDGSPASRSGLAMAGLSNPHLHRDGRRVAFQLGQAGSVEVWAMENLLSVSGAESR